MSPFVPPEPPRELERQLISAAQQESPSDAALERAMAAIDEEQAAPESHPRGQAAEPAARAATNGDEHVADTATTTPPMATPARRPPWIAIAAIALGSVSLFATLKLIDRRDPVAAPTPATMMTALATVAPAPTAAAAASTTASTTSAPSATASTSASSSPERVAQRGPAAAPKAKPAGSAHPAPSSSPPSPSAPSPAGKCGCAPSDLVCAMRCDQK